MYLRSIEDEEILLTSTSYIIVGEMYRPRWVPHFVLKVSAANYFSDFSYKGIHRTSVSISRIGCEISGVHSENRVASEIKLLSLVTSCHINFLSEIVRLRSPQYPAMLIYLPFIGSLSSSPCWREMLINLHSVRCRCYWVLCL